jgi:hypothetical protein
MHHFHKYIIFFILLVPFTENVPGQKISTACTGQSLTKVFAEISQKYHIKIAFDTQVADKIIVSQKLSQIPADDAFNKILEGTGLKAQRLGDIYMIVPEPNPVKTEPAFVQTIKKTVEKAKKYINGIVKDGLSGEGLPYASVYYGKGQMGTNANER